MHLSSQIYGYAARYKIIYHSKKYYLHYSADKLQIIYLVEISDEIKCT